LVFRVRRGPISGEFWRMPMPAPLKVTIAAARRFVRRTLLLDAPAPDVAAALVHLGYVQIDPLNVCGRMHDLILRNRVTGYQEDALHAHLHAPERRGFEHYLQGGHGVLAAFPLEAWPFLTGGMQRRSRLRHAHSGRLTPREAALAERILGEIGARGPLTSDDIEHEGRARSAWGRQGRLVKHVLEKLFAHGCVLIAARRGFRRVYDLPERVLPRALLDQPPRAEPEVEAWVVRQRLKQRRLVSLNRRELLLVADQVQPVAVDGLPVLYCLREDAALFDAVMAGAPPASSPVLLAPLDPLIYDRRLTRDLWGFDYTWEAYTPAAKRKRGHYALPVLAGTEIVGHVDPKADRERGRLQIISRRVRCGHKIAAAVKELGGFLGLRA
jgi:uncharacterized protein YcaQ